MKFKRLTVWIVSLSILFSFNTAVCETDEAKTAPKAVIIEPEFEFKTVPAGTKVTHDYVIKNEGTATLKIIKVKPG